MTAYFPSNHKGMALFQVLVMVGIFSTLLLLMSGFSQQSVIQTHQLQSITEQKLRLYSAQKRLQYQLLTEHWVQRVNATEMKSWNFYGQPFKFASTAVASAQSDLTYSIQDLSSLFNWQIPQQELVNLLEMQGVKKAQAQAMRQELIDAQTLIGKLAMGRKITSKYPHLPFYHQDEVAQLTQWSETVVQQLSPFMNLYSQSFNPFNLPDEMLPALLSASQVDIIRQWRQQRDYTSTKFSLLTGIQQDDLVSFYPGPAFRIEVSQDDSDMVLVAELKLTPYLKVPLVRFSQFYKAKNSSKT
jgi:hypothetical protein